MEHPETSLLDQVNSPESLRKIKQEKLPQLAHELRAEVIRAVSVTGGHLGAGLGVVELTVALHYVFNTPHDRLIWDVGHQCYPHKILTGRRDQMQTLRRGGGLSGFTKREESIYDPFGAAHSSTSISAGLGMAVASDLLNTDRKVIAVIGDGAMSAGMAYEAMNNASTRDGRMIVILNDNDMSIAPPVGAMSNYLSTLVSSRPYTTLRSLVREISEKVSGQLARVARRADEYARGMVMGGTLFEEMGFFYVGPVDGHNVEQLIKILSNLRESKSSRPILLHIVTKKGYGYAPAEAAADKYHGVSSFDVVTGQQKKGKTDAPNYTAVFADSLCNLAKTDDKIVAVTAAMPSGTGLGTFAKTYPNRFFDVGIAEQHAVTFCAGLAADGMKPFAAIYSTFLQRAYDQVVHDVAIQNLPVRFAIDRAGLVGADGQTHAGSFDLAYLCCLPNMVVMAAGDEAELQLMTATAAEWNDGPIAFRYPRGEGLGAALHETLVPLEIGKGRILIEGQQVALLNLGGRLGDCMTAVKILAKHGVSVTLADARFAKPLDTSLLRRLVREHDAILTIEEGSSGGFGALVLQELSDMGLLDSGVKIRTLRLPDKFIDHDSPAAQYVTAGLDANSIARAVLTCMKHNTNNLEAV